MLYVRSALSPSHRGLPAVDTTGSIFTRGLVARTGGAEGYLYENEVSERFREAVAIRTQTRCLQCT